MGQVHEPAFFNTGNLLSCRVLSFAFCDCHLGDAKLSAIPLYAYGFEHFLTWTDSILHVDIEDMAFRTLWRLLMSTLKRFIQKVRT